MSFDHASDNPPLVAFSLLHESERPDDFLRVAPLKRDWMEKTPDRFAYRCLPLNIANMLGWELINPVGFEATWDGSDHKDGIRIIPDVEGHARMPVSHFGSGILTFHTPFLFRTPPGIQLMTTGPINQVKDGIAPLAGVIETDWLPFTFTMNWKFTTGNNPVRFEAGEPIAVIVPVMLSMIEAMEPQIVDMKDEEGLQDRFNEWFTSRNEFNDRLAQGDPETLKEGWQRHYFQGKHLDGLASNAEHRTKMNLRSFEDRRPKPAPFVGINPNYRMNIKA